MRNICRGGVTAAWVALALILGGAGQASAASAKARPPAAVAADPATAEQMGARLAGLVLKHMNELKPYYDRTFSTALADSMKDRTGTDPFAEKVLARFQGWALLFGDAAWEELVADRPQLEAIAGRYLARKFTLPELRALVTLGEGPYGDSLWEGALIKLRDPHADPKPSTEALAALRRFMSTPEGRSAAQKMKRWRATVKSDSELQDATIEVIAVWAPGAARRWGEKAQAAEAARAAAPQAPVSPPTPPPPPPLPIPAPNPRGMPTPVVPVT